MPLEIELANIPETERTDEVCLAAVMDNPDSLQYVPIEKRNYKICLAALGKTNFNNRESFLQTIADYTSQTALRPEEYESLVSKVFESRPDLLNIIPFELRTPLICEATIDEDFSPEIFNSFPIDSRSYKSVKTLAERVHSPRSCREFFEVIGDYNINTKINSKEYSLVANKLLRTYGHMLEFVPESLRSDDLCKTALVSNSRAFAFVPTKQITHKFFENVLNTILERTGPQDAFTFIKNVYDNLDNTPISKDEFVNAITAHLGQMGTLLQFIPAELRTEEQCKAALENDPNAFEFLPLRFRSYENAKTAVNLGTKGSIIDIISVDFAEYEKEKEKMRQEQIAKHKLEEKSNPNQVQTAGKRKSKQQQQMEQQNRIDLKFYIDKLQYRELAMLSVQKTGHGLFALTKSELNNEVCLNAILLNPMELKDIENFESKTALTDLEYKNICLEAFMKNEDSIQFVAPKFKIDVLIQAVINDEKYMDYIKRMDLSPEEFKKICLKGAEGNPLILHYLDENESLREEIITEVTPTKMLSVNINAKNYFPQTQYYSDVVEKFISELQNVVIVFDDGEPEIKDSYHVYSSAQQRAGKTALVRYNEMDDFFSNAKFKNNINLVLLGHANVHSKDVAGVDQVKLLQTLKNNEQISKVTLLGCHTAQAERLREEEEIIKKHQELNKSKTIPKAGMILSLTAPSETDIQTYFTKISPAKDGNTVDSFYVLVKNMQDPKHYDLIFVERNKSPHQHFSLNTDDVNLLSKEMGSSKGLPFPTKKNPHPHYLRGSKSGELLNNNELSKIMEVIEKGTKYSKKNVNYRERKETLPFLRSARVREDEMSKVLPSFMKRIMDAISADPDIKRDIEVKGYINAMHADVKEGQFKGTKTFLFGDGYKTSKSSFFFSGKDSINRKKLKEEWENIEATMDQDKSETMLKAIKVNLRKR